MGYEEHFLQHPIFFGGELWRKIAFQRSSSLVFERCLRVLTIKYRAVLRLLWIICGELKAIRWTG